MLLPHNCHLDKSSKTNTKLYNFSSFLADNPNSRLIHGEKLLINKINVFMRDVRAAFIDPLEGQKNQEMCNNAISNFNVIMFALIFVINQQFDEIHYHRPMQNSSIFNWKKEMFVIYGRSESKPSIKLLKFMKPFSK